MKTVLVLQHVPHEGPGGLTSLLQTPGFQIETLRFWDYSESKAAPEDFDGLIVMGGPMGVYDADRYGHLAWERKAIERAVKNNLPVLGICLGAQLIASALGARVYPSGAKEIGWYDVALTPRAATDLLLAHFRTTEKVFQWHGDTFDIPREAVHLASSPLCANQAFRYGKNVYGLQFHIEVDEAIIRSWLDVPENQKEMASLRGKIDPQTIRNETPIYIERLRELSRQTSAAFARLFDD